MPNFPDEEAHMGEHPETTGTRLGGDRQPAVGPELGDEARPTPGDPALARQEKEEVDRYVEWQHDADSEYLHGRGR